MVLETKLNKHILIVDDDDGIRATLEAQLSKIGYRASVAGNGLHALQKIRANGHYDLVICDLKMPGMSGIEFIKVLRSESLHKEMPILLITGYPEKQKIVEAIRTGITRVLLKPFKQQQIVTLIEDLLEHAA